MQVQDQDPHGACALSPGCRHGAGSCRFAWARRIWEVAESKLSLEHGFLCGVRRAGSVITLLVSRRLLLRG